MVAVEVAVEDLAAAEAQLLGERVAEPHREPALDLHLRAVRVDDDSHVLRTDDPPDADLAALRIDGHFRHRRDIAPASIAHATPTPRPLGAGAGRQPKAAAAACNAVRMRWSVRWRRRNSTGSTPAAAAMMSICDSIAKTFMLAPGARHGPTANGCMRGAGTAGPYDIAPAERILSAGMS